MSFTNDQIAKLRDAALSIHQASDLAHKLEALAVVLHEYGDDGDALSEREGVIATLLGEVRSVSTQINDLLADASLDTVIVARQHGAFDEPA